jgi:hypothetical protein
LIAQPEMSAVLSQTQELAMFSSLELSTLTLGDGELTKEGPERDGHPEVVSHPSGEESLLI